MEILPFFVLDTFDALLFIKNFRFIHSDDKKSEIAFSSFLPLENTQQEAIMDQLIFLLFWIILGIFFLLRVFFALFFPNRFAEGASKNLFIKDRVRALFPDTPTKEAKECNPPFQKASELQNKTRQKDASQTTTPK